LAVQSLYSPRAMDSSLSCDARAKRSMNWLPRLVEQAGERLRCRLICASRFRSSVSPMRRQSRHSTRRASQQCRLWHVHEDRADRLEHSASSASAAASGPISLAGRTADDRSPARGGTPQRRFNYGLCAPAPKHGHLFHVRIPCGVVLGCARFEVAGTGDHARPRPGRREPPSSKAVPSSRPHDEADAAIERHRPSPSRGPGGPV